MLDFTAPYDKNIAHKIGLIQGPDESLEQFQTRIHEAFHNRVSQADSYIFGWIPVFYTNKGLSFFEAGATIIEEKNGIPCPKIILRKAYKTKNKWLLYTKEEVLKHEMIHAIRCAFDEPIFEEFIAYSTSKNAFRRYVGPIFQNQLEVVIFMITSLAPAMIFNFFSLSTSIISVAFFVMRLKYRHSFFKKYPKEKDVFSLAQLTDKKIRSELF